MASVSTCRTDNERNIQKRLDGYLKLIDQLAVDQNSMEIDMSNKSDLIEAQKRLILNLAIEIENILPEDIKPLYQSQFEILNEMWNQQINALKCSESLLNEIQNQDKLNKTLENLITTLNQPANEFDNEVEETKQLKIEFKKHKKHLQYLMDNFCSEELKNVLKILMAASEDYFNDYVELNENVDLNLIQKLLDEKLIITDPENKKRIRFIDPSE